MKVEIFKETRRLRAFFESIKIDVPLSSIIRVAKMSKEEQNKEVAKVISEEIQALQSKIDKLKEARFGL